MLSMSVVLTLNVTVSKGASVSKSTETSTPPPPVLSAIRGEGTTAAAAAVRPLSCAACFEARGARDWERSVLIEIKRKAAESAGVDRGGHSFQCPQGADAADVEGPLP